MACIHFSNSKLENVVWGSWALFGVLLPMLMELHIHSTLPDGVFSALSFHVHLAFFKIYTCKSKVQCCQVIMQTSV